MLFHKSKLWWSVSENSMTADDHDNRKALSEHGWYVGLACYIYNKPMKKKNSFTNWIFGETSQNENFLLPISTNKRIKTSWKTLYFKDFRYITKLTELYEHLTTSKWYYLLNPFQT